jgi:tetratricopeptide (TPR) repeat protein
MAETTLRDYVKSVDQLIEREKLDEAIAHCRYILETYPKHLDTYRLLGKAYLEAKRYGDSADIFQRVLSAIPDDFVAHIGMAIVREDEGNLDAAIWHMERAFETNPANPAIQQELKRLIGRRDGLEPHKVRLTRGALARMYAHGDLYPQAIAELRSALQEDADRPDLQVLLAEMYWRTDQRAEAAEVCNQVLQKLPYCREANRILAAILHASGKVDEAAAYHRRLAALDPYAAYVENVTIDPGTVDANSLKLERLEWEAGRPLPAAPTPVSDWASSLGLGEAESGAELVESAETETPAWLESASEMPPSAQEQPEAEPAPEAVQPFAAPEPPAEEIPDWMAEAGWSPATGEAQEGPVSFSDEELSTLEADMPPAPAPEEGEEGELAPAEIPDWLQDKAPPPEELLRAAEMPEPPMAEGAGPPDWVRTIDEGVEGVTPEPAIPSHAADRTPTEPEGFGEEELGPQFEAEEEGPPAPAGAEGEEEAPAIPTWLEEVTPGATSTIVTWLGDKAKEGPQAPGEGEVPSWMKQVAPQEFESREPQPEAESSEAPEWLEEVGEAAEPLSGEEPAEEAEVPGPSPAPAWLAGVAEAAAQDSTPDLGEVSEFLQEEPEAPAVEPFEGMEEAAAPMEPAAPDWLKAIASPEEEPPQEPALEQGPVDEASTDWLRGLATESGEPQPEPAAPDWLDGLGESTPAAGAEPAAEMDWLEGLGEPTGEAPSAAEVPEWLEGLGAPAAPGPRDEAEAPPIFEERAHAEAELPAAPSSDQIPGWLDGFGAAGEGEREEAPVEAAPPAGEAHQEMGLDWLEEEPAPSIEEPVAEAAPPTGAEEVTLGEFPYGPVDDDEVFRWLEDLATKQGDETESVEPTAIGTGGLGEAQEPAISSEVEFPEEPGEGLEWLEKLASERGLPEEPEEEEITFEEAPAPEAAEPALDWMLEAEATIETEPSAGPVEEEGEEEALGWMVEMAQGEPAEPAEPPAAVAPEEEMSAPEWLVTMGAEEEPAEAEMPSAVPSEEEGLEWLEQMAGETERVSEAPSETIEAAEEIEWTEFEEAATAEITGVAEEEIAPPGPEEAVAPAIEEPGEEEVLEWLTRMSAEAGEAPQEALAEPQEAQPEAAVEEPSPIPPEAPEAPVTAEAEAAPPAPVSLEWLRIPAEEIPAPRAETPPSEWPEFEAAEVPPAPPTPTPEAAPAAEAPPIAAPEAAPAPEAPPIPTAEVPAEVPAVEAAPPVEVPPTPPEPAAPKPSKKDAGQILESARTALAEAEIDRAIKDYAALIKRRSQLPDVIGDLKAAVELDPDAAGLWQVLGDAYMKDGQVNDAIEAYRRGMGVA